MQWRCHLASSPHFIPCFFFFNDTATTEIYTLSLHDALPIFPELLRTVENPLRCHALAAHMAKARSSQRAHDRDRKSTRLNSSHSQISYAVFCLKKKKQKKNSYFSQQKHNHLTQAICRRMRNR